MALIKCPECGKEISDKAKACPNCGAPAEKKKVKVHIFRAKQLIALVSICLLLAIIVGTFFIISHRKALEIIQMPYGLTPEMSLAEIKEAIESNGNKYVKPVYDPVDVYLGNLDNPVGMEFNSSKRLFGLVPETSTIKLYDDGSLYVIYPYSLSDKPNTHIILENLIKRYNKPQYYVERENVEEWWWWNENDKVILIFNLLKLNGDGFEDYLEYYSGDDAQSMIENIKKELNNI